MRAIILHLRVPEDFVEICMKEWDGNKPISKLRIADLYEKYLTYAASFYGNQMDYEEFIQQNLTNKQI